MVTDRTVASLRQAPFGALIAWVWTAFTIEVDNAIEAGAGAASRRHFRISLPMWANGLRLIESDGVTVAELQSRARASCNLGGLERWGWIVVGDNGPGRRAGFGSHRGIKPGTLLRPTKGGAEARRRFPQVIAEVEEAWERRFGREVIDGLRGALDAPAQPMPWSPPEVHPSDGFYTHVVAAQGDGESGPLIALLGQVLTALTLDAERDAKVSLPLAVNFLRVIDSRVVQVRDLPARSGVSREAVAMGVNYLMRTRLAEPGPTKRSVSLTPAGLDALERCQTVAARQKNGDCQEALIGVLSQRESLVEGLVPPEGCWRGERPYLAQTQRVLADPLASLPRHPMVLHRGGWPDGS
jgi:hypothetical protein